MPSECGVRTVCCIHGYHAAVGELLACKREWKNTVDMNCGSKLLLDTEQKAVMCLLWVTCRYRKRGRLTWNN